MILTYLDTGVLIAAWKGPQKLKKIAYEILNDPNRSFASGFFVKLETIPKATYENHPEEVEFYEAYINRCAERIAASREIFDKALEEAKKYGLRGIDSLHVVSAVEAGAQELITTEKPEKTIHRTESISTRSIR